MLDREYGAGGTSQALAPRRLPGTPTESEAPVAQINRQVTKNHEQKRGALKVILLGHPRKIILIYCF